MAKFITVREGSQEFVDFVLKQDTTGDGIPNAAIDLTEIASLEMRLKKRSDGLTNAFKTTDGSPQLVITDAVNGKARFSPKTTDWVLDDIFYDGFFIIIDGANKSIPVAEDNNFKITVFAKH